MRDQPPAPEIEKAAFERAFALFIRILNDREPTRRPFRSFREGVMHGAEGYKLDLFAAGRQRLGADTWAEGDIGTGRILSSVIAAIEIDKPVNNLLDWQGIYGGPSGKGHAKLLAAQGNPKDRTNVERVLFALYKDRGSEAHIFDILANFTGQYPSIGYLFFLKDSSRFLPVRPAGLENGIREIGQTLKLSGRCSWANYSQFLALVEALRDRLQARLPGQEVQLIDAHSFLWVLGHWERKSGRLAKPQPGAVSVSGPYSRAAYIMAASILSTVSQSNGQTVERVMKDKTTSMPQDELMAHLEDLLVETGGRCAISGLPLDLGSPPQDRDLQPSPDRIDSNGHYERGNIQVVCWFINRWKSDDGNVNFRRLLELVRRTPASSFGNSASSPASPR